MRRIPPATKVRHARAQHAAQSAKQPSDLCFLLQASSNKLRIPACSLVCRLRLGRAQLQPSVQGRGDRHGGRAQGAAAASNARSLHAISSQTTAGMACKHRPSPARPASSCRPPLWPCAYTARIASRSQTPGASSLALLAGAGGAQVRAQHAAARPKQSNRRSSRIQRRKMPCWSGCRRYWWAVRAQSKLDAQRSKVSTLVPNSLRSASQRII